MKDEKVGYLNLIFVRRLAQIFSRSIPKIGVNLRRILL